MKFQEFGDKNLPPILIRWWQFLVELSSSSTNFVKYRVILPTADQPRQMCSLCHEVWDLNKIQQF